MLRLETTREVPASVAKRTTHRTANHPPAHHRHQLRRRPGQVACAAVVGQAQRLGTASASADAGERAVSLHVDGPRRAQAGLPVGRLGDALHTAKDRLDRCDDRVHGGDPVVAGAEVADLALGGSLGIVAEPWPCAGRVGRCGDVGGKFGRSRRLKGAWQVHLCQPSKSAAPSKLATRAQQRTRPTAKTAHRGQTAPACPRPSWPRTGSAQRRRRRPTGTRRRRP